MIKAVLFDWSGVLIDEIEASALADIDTIVELGGERISLQTWLSEIRQDWKILFRKYGIKKEDLQKVLPIHEKRFEKYRHLVKPIEGTEYVLERLKGMGITVGIVSGQPRKVIDDSSQRFGLERFIDFVVSGDDVINQKPHPESLHVAIKKAGCGTNEMACIDDMPDILDQAKELGMITIGFKSPISGDLSNARYVIDKLTDILKIVKTEA